MSVRNSKGFTSLETGIPGRESRGFPTGLVRRNSSYGAGFILRELPVVIAAIRLSRVILPPGLQKADAADLRGGTFGAWGKVRFQTNICRGAGCYGSFTDGSPGRA